MTVLLGTGMMQCLATTMMPTLVCIAIPRRSSGTLRTLPLESSHHMLLIKVLLELELML